MTTLGDELREVGPTRAEAALVWFLRIMSAFVMAAGLNYWAALIGIGNVALPRFDLLPLHWQVPCVVLAVLLPCASMGMWMLTSWGVVLWCVSMLIEIAIYGIWSDIYVAKLWLVGAHGAALTVLSVMLAVVLMQRIRANK